MSRPWRGRWTSDTPPSAPVRRTGSRLCFSSARRKDWACLLQQFDLGKPAMRFGIRLSLAMLTGLALTLVFPRFAHANWMLLTIALIMRANYSITSQRRWDRITGTLIGCAIAVALIAISPPAFLLTVIVLAIGLSHAYAGVQYRITAVGASISSLVLLHFSAPTVHPQFFERVADTLIGAALSYVFSFPAAELGAQRFAPPGARACCPPIAPFADAALRRAHIRQPYRLARKQTLDAVAQISGRDPPPGRRAQDQPAHSGGVERIAGRQLCASPPIWPRCPC